MKKIISAVIISILSSSAMASGYGLSRALQGAVDGINAAESRRYGYNGGYSDYDYRPPYGNSYQDESLNIQRERNELLREQNYLIEMDSYNRNGFTNYE